MVIIPVIILNWNGEEDTLECLRSIRKSVPAGFAPVVVDNGSKPESLERLKHGCSEIFSRILFLRKNELATPNDKLCAEVPKYLGEDALVFIENGENLGFAKGNNVGVRFAKVAGSEWVMLLNNDTVVAPEAFLELRKFLKNHPEFPAITAQLRHYRQNTRIQNCGGDLTYFGSRKYKYENMDVSRLPESDHSVVTFVTGCALLFRYKVTGGLSEDFFFGEEDYEFALRVRKMGLKMACANGAVVYHKVGASAHRGSRPIGSLRVHYANRLVNTRAYYSKVRWHATRLLAYLRLPVLLGRQGIGPLKSISIIRHTEAYLRAHRDVGRADFESMITMNF